MVEKKKKPSVKKTGKKSTNVKKHVVEKKPVSKKEHKDINRNHEKVEEKVENSTSVIIGVLLIVVLLLLGGIVYLLITQANTTPSVVNVSANGTNSSSVTKTSSDNSQAVVLTVIDDPTCTTCNVDLFAKQVKDNLIKDLVVEKVLYNSTDGKAMIKAFGANQVPTYLFSENIDKRADWATKLASAFIKKEYNGRIYYMLNPEYVPSKEMITEPKVLSGAVVYGNKSAKVTIFEFSDYECPFCGIAEGNKALDEQFQAREPGYVAPMPMVYKDYIDTGKVKLVFYNMALTQLHPHVKIAHEASLCANEQGKWKEFHDKLYLDRKDWVGKSNYTSIMKNFAKDLGLNTAKFDSCLDSHKYLNQINNEINYGRSLGVSGTPAFFIDKHFISGAQNFSTFKTIIDAELARANN